MAYEHLSDEDKVSEAIRFVARGTSLPRQLEDFLRQEGIYELIVNPQELHDELSEGVSPEH